MRGGLMMWIGAFVFVLGFIALIIGARLNSIVESGIKEGVEKEVIVTESSGQDSKFMTMVQPYSYFFFNITNAKEVILNKSVPIVKEIEVKFTRTQQKYDFTVSGDTYGYREFTYYTPVTPAEYDLPFITLNPVYIGAAIGQGGSELGFQTALTPAVLQQLVPVLMDPEGFLKVFQLAVFPGYLASLLAACLQLPLAPFNVTGPAACVQQWGVQDQIGGQLIAEVSPAYSKFTGWELSSPILPAVASLLWDQNNIASLTNLTGVQQWGRLGMYAAQVARGNASAIPLYNATLTSLITNLPGLDVAQSMVVLEYLSSQFNSSSVQSEVYYFQIIKAGLNHTTFPVVAEAQTWEDLLTLQFSQSVLTRSLQRGNSLSNPVFEFMAYQIDVKGGQYISAVNLTLNESRTFLEYFQVDGSVTYFGATLLAIVEGRLPAEDLAQFEPMGIRLDTILDIATYILDYLPATFALKGKLGLGTVLPDGTHPSNTGMFVRRTVREILHGYDDPLLALMGENQTQIWTGLVGPEIRTVAEARAYDTLRNKTGKLSVFLRTDLNNLDTFRQWEGLTEFDLSTTLGGHCPSIAWVSDPEAVNCTVWQNPEVVTGQHHHLQFSPFQEDNPANPISIFAPQLFRNVWFDYAGDVVVEEITMRRYKIRASELKNEADNQGNAKAQERSRNYRVSVSGFQDLSTAFDMTPIHLGVPKHYSNLAEHNKIMGLTAGDWNDTTNIAPLETFLDVEPLTGKLMQGRQRLQVNIKLESARLNGVYASMYTSDSGSVMFPIMWAQEGDTISHEDAETFRSSIYDNRSLGKSWTVVLIVFGMILMVLGLGALCKGWRVYRVKEANETMPLRGTDKKTFF
jgi:hypothetical protein